VLMLITMDDWRLIQVTQLQEFLKASQRVVVSLEESSLVIATYDRHL
jgi:hypothetical protein